MINQEEKREPLGDNDSINDVVEMFLFSENAEICRKLVKGCISNYTCYKGQCTTTPELTAVYSTLIIVCFLNSSEVGSMQSFLIKAQKYKK